MGLTVLITDDDEGVRFFHNLIVSQIMPSAKSISFINAGKTLDYLNRHSGDLNEYLVLLDVNMPVMNAWDFLEAISDKSYCSRVYIVMVSSAADKPVQAKAKTYSNVIDVVEKPITEEAFTKIIRHSPIARYI